MSKSQFINLYKSQADAAFKFQIDASQENAKFVSDRPMRFDNEIELKSGALYKSVNMQIFVDTPNKIEEHYQFFGNELNAVRLTATNEAIARLAGDAKNTTDLSSEQKARSDADTNFMGLLTNETSARVSSDSTQTNALTFEVSRATAQENSILAALVVEKKEREDSDALEISARTSAVNVEKAARELADVSLNSRCDTLVIADSDEKKARESADSDEKKARESADSALGVRCDAINTRVDNLVINLDTSKLDSLAEIVNKMNSTGLDAYQRLSYLEQVLGELRNSPLYAVPKPPYAVDVPASL